MDEKTRALNDQVFALQTQINTLNVDNGGLKDDIKQRQSELEMLTDKLKQTEQARQRLAVDYQNSVLELNKQQLTSKELSEMLRKKSAALEKLRQKFDEQVQALQQS